RVLRQVIRFYGDSMQSTMSGYLDLSLQLFNEQSQQFRDQLKRLLHNNNNPVKALRELSQPHLTIWRSVRREFLSNLSAGSAGGRRREGQERPSRKEQPEDSRKEETAQETSIRDQSS